MRVDHHELDVDDHHDDHHDDDTRHDHDHGGADDDDRGEHDVDEHNDIGSDDDVTLAEQRVLFTRCVAKLLAFAETQGILVALDQGKRTQVEADANAASGAGIVHSLHVLGLAEDVVIYRKIGDDLVYLNTGTEAEYATLGAYWKTLDPLCCWGGDFESRPDYDHFSSTRGGVR